MQPLGNRWQPVQVRLDGCMVILPGETLKSLRQVRFQLELMALRQSRVLSTLQVDGTEVDLSQTGEERPFRSVQAHTVSLGTLRDQITRTALRQAGSIHARAMALVSLVLINEWPVSCRQARIVVGKLRTLGALLGFFRDVSADPQGSPDPDVIARFQSEARMLLDQWSGLEIDNNNLALSDWLEYNVVPWSSNVATTLQKMC